MGEWFNSLTSLEKVFLFCAAVGSVLFLIRTVLQFMGGDAEGGEDVPDDMPDDAPGDIGDSDVSFRFITLQGFIAFGMIFGLVGLAMKQNSGANDMNSIVVASVAGLAVMWLQARLMTSLLRLQSSGTLKMGGVVGTEGTVYMDIPAEGTGKVRIVVQNRLKVFDATSNEAEVIPTGEPVRVTRLAGGNILVVERAV